MSRPGTELKNIGPAHEFEHNGSRWMRGFPLWTGDEKPDAALRLGEEADDDVANGGVVRIWCACLTDGPWAKKGGICPLPETTQVEEI